MRYIEDYSNQYLKNNFEIIQVKYRRKKVLEQMQQYAPKTVLEIGCGMEPMFTDYKDFRNFFVVEPSKYFYQNAKTLAINLKNVTIFNDYFEFCLETFKEITFDFIIISGLLHEVEKPNSIVKFVSSICNEKTIVHANVPNANSFHRILAKEAGIIDNIFNLSESNKIFQQNNVFDIKRFIQLFIMNNFEIIESGSYFIKPFTHAQMDELLSLKIINEQILDGLFKMIKFMPEFGSEIFVNCRLND